MILENTIGKLKKLIKYFKKYIKWLRLDTVHHAHKMNCRACRKFDIKLKKLEAECGIPNKIGYKWTWYPVCFSCFMYYLDSYQVKTWFWNDKRHNAKDDKSFTPELKGYKDSLCQQ